MAKKRDLQEIDYVSGELEKLKKQSAKLSDFEIAKQKQRKSIIILASIVAALLIVSFVGVVIHFATQSPVSYAPKASAAEITEERTKEHERRLKIIDDNGGIREGVNFVGYHARFDDEDNLVVDGYMRNFTGHKIYNIKGNITVETTNGDNVGGAYFEFPEKEFGSLENGKSRPWRLIFDADYVNVEITDLSEFTILTEFEYYYK